MEGEKIKIFQPLENFARLLTKTSQIWPPVKETQRLRGPPSSTSIGVCRQLASFYNALERNLLIGPPSSKCPKETPFL
jgi:hypothetical protein